MRLALLLACATLACSDFKTSSTPGDDGGGLPDSGTDPDAGLGADTSAGPPPKDYECTGPWRGIGKPDPTCVDVRKSFVIDGPILTTGGLSIARTAAGRIGVAFDHMNDLDDTGLFLDSFLQPSAPSDVIKPQRQKVGFGLGIHVGHALALAARGPGDTLHLIYSDEDVQELHYQRLEDGKAPLTTTELVTSGVAAGIRLSLAVSPKGDARAAFWAPSAKALRSAARLPTGGFDTPSEIVAGLLTDAPGTGQSSLVFDDSSTPHLLFQHCEVPNFSTPRYHTFDGAQWSYRKTVDNNVLDGYAGFSPSLALFGSHKYAAFYFFKAGQSAPFTAELHLVDWVQASDTPTLTTLDKVIPAGSPTDGTIRLFRFQASLAVDKFGLLHMAVVRPNSSNQHGELDYNRQALVNGQVKWLSDVVDDEVLSDPSLGAGDAFVSIVVDENARPHIAYRNGKDAKVYYATRFDR